MRLILLFLFAFSSSTFADDAFRPALQAATVDDAWSLFDNPAGLAWVSGAEFVGGYEHEWPLLAGRSTVHHAQGILALSFFKGFAIGFGGNLMMPSSITPTQSGGSISGTLGASFGWADAFSFGLDISKGRQFALSESDPFLFGAGLQLRPLPWFAFGVFAKEVYGGFFSPFETRIGLGFKPVSELVTIGTDVRIRPTQNAWGERFAVDPGVQLSVDFGGMAVLASCELRDVGRSLTAPFLGLGVVINFEHLGATMLGAGKPDTNGLAGVQFRVSSEKWPSVVAPEKKWLHLALIDDGVFQEPKQPLINRLLTRPKHPLETMNTLKELEKDSSVEGIVLKLDRLSVGFARAEELHNILQSLRKSKKKIIIYLDQVDEVEYQIATAADQIWLSPAGTIRLGKFRHTFVYLDRGLKKFGISAQEVHAGRYKSAPRMFVANEPNEEELEVANAILDAQVGTLKNAVEQNRKVSPDKFQTSIDFGEVTANDALQAGLIDKIVSESDIGNELIKFNQHRTFFDHNYMQIKKRDKHWNRPISIAGIPISGMIVRGSKSPSLLPDFFEMAYADDVVQQIRQASLDSTVAAIVVRIDSPGGDAIASEQIFRALLQARQAKPVVASMGDVAASGGYYVAAAAEEIYAGNATVTGSIGVFSLHFSGKELANKLGVSSYEVSRSKRPGGHLLRPLSEIELSRQQQIVNFHYEQFKNAVKFGQRLSEEHLEPIAQGRVWTGKEANERKLVSHVGGFIEALARAKELARVGHLQNVQLRMMVPGFVSELPIQATAMSEQSVTKQLLSNFGDKPMSLAPLWLTKPQTTMLLIPLDHPTLP